MASVRLVKNIGLGDAATGVQTGTVAEPTAAGFNNELFVTGNWFASRSANGGASWSYVSPFSAFPSVAGGFCCDQVVLHERNKNLWLWILQYVQQGGTNAFRLAVSTSGKAAPPWTSWTFSPPSVDPGWATNAWFDYPDAAVTNNHLYVTFNVFNTAGNWLAAVVFKYPLAALAGKTNLPWEFFKVTDFGSLRLVRGATTDMFFASHRGVNPVRVYRWPDAPGSSISWFDVSPGGWRGNTPYSSKGPGGAEWLARVDPRITGAWTVGRQAGFLWSSNSISGRPQPFVKAVVVDTTTKAIVSQPDIWNPSVAWAIASACPNVNGAVGASMFYGGGTAHPTHVVGILAGGSWSFAASRASTNGPAGGTWGDYVSCQLHDPGGKEWVASGYTLQGGNDGQFIEPQYVHFAAGP